MTPEEVAAVMAAHEHHRQGNGHCWGGPFVADLSKHPHCEPYRLAEALIAARVRATQAEALLPFSDLLLIHPELRTVVEKETNRAQ